MSKLLLEKRDEGKEPCRPLGELGQRSERALAFSAWLPSADIAATLSPNGCLVPGVRSPRGGAATPPPPACPPLMRTLPAGSVLFPQAPGCCLSALCGPASFPDPSTSPRRSLTAT